MIKTLHRFLSRYMFYPLALASLIAMWFFLVRNYLRSDWYGPRLHVNLFLAWAPYVIALLAVAVHRRWPRNHWIILLLGGLWLVFFPNAPYLITDYFYLSRTENAVWQSLMVYTLFSVCGLMLAMVSLFFMHAITRRLFGRLVGWLVVLGAISVSSLGVFMGRFLRWNSWDLLTQPGEVILSSIPQFFTPVQGIRPITFSVMFSAVLFILYYIILSLSDSTLVPDERT